MNKLSTLLSFLCICLALSVVFLGFKIKGLSFGNGEPQGIWSHEEQRALANKLKSAGLPVQAIKEYEKYVMAAPVDKKQMANLSYSIGKMYMEEGRYENALSWFYRVEIVNPETPLKTELGSKIINCLERSGKYNAAEYTLGKRASRKKDDGRQGSKVVAKIGNENIYLVEINEALDAMPAWMKNQLKGRQAKTEFLKKYVADELFYRKALKLEYDKNPDLRKRLQAIEKELMVNKVLEEELKGKIKVEEEDLRNYYQAHKEDYTEKEAVKVSFIKSGMKEVADRIIEEVTKGKDFNQLAYEISLDNETAKNRGRFNGWVRKGEDDLGIGNVKEVSNVLFSAIKGKLSQPVEAGGYYYVFRVEEKRPAKTQTFQEVAERVKNDYFMKKAQIAHKNLLEQILKTSEVKLFPEALPEGESS
jgi:peptidyl-prolyl cis-trans isomerase C